MDVSIERFDAFGGTFLYRIWLDGEKYTSFIAKPPLTWSQEHDVVALYREAFEYWS